MRRAILVCLLHFVVAIPIASPAQTFIKLADFDGANGFDPGVGLIQANDGNFYCTTRIGGHGQGTVSKISPQGAVTALYSFTGTDNGFWPVSGVIQATDGNFYGTTAFGGQGGYGTIYKITPGGELTTLYNFGSGEIGTSPYAGLVQATDGNLYGATEFGGTNGGYGTIYKITFGGVLTTIYSFGGADGAGPYSRLPGSATVICTALRPPEELMEEAQFSKSP